MNISKKFFIKSRTNENEQAKQYFFVINSDKFDNVLIVRKLVLSKNLRLYAGKYKILKTFKGYYLFESEFSIKLNTLKMVNEIIF